jgi:hypothetical protein
MIVDQGPHRPAEMWLDLADQWLVRTMRRNLPSERIGPVDDVPG